MASGDSVASRPAGSLEVTEREASEAGIDANNKGNGLTATRSTDRSLLPLGAAITSSGRISAARLPDTPVSTPPFTTQELIALDENLTWATQLTNVRFSTYVGDLGTDAYRGAVSVFPSIPEPEYGCLIAVSPNTNDVVVLSGVKVAHKITDKTTQLGVNAAISALKDGSLIDGLISAVRVIANAAR